MNNRLLIASSGIVLLGTICVSSASASLIATILGGTDFPSAAEFQTLDPNVSGTNLAERDLKVDRNLSQTFQLGSAVDVNEIDVLYARGFSGATGRVRIFEVADTLAGNITGDYNDAVTNGFLLDETFDMPTAPADDRSRTLKLALSSPLNLPAVASPGGYALNLTSADGVSGVFTWKFGDTGSTGYYADGRVYYDDFVSSGSTETRRDGVFALNGDVTGPIVPEPTSILLLVICLGLSVCRRV
jgi:hypothetical protein